MWDVIVLIPDHCLSIYSDEEDQHIQFSIVYDRIYQVNHT